MKPSSLSTASPTNPDIETLERVRYPVQATPLPPAVSASGQPSKGSDTGEESKVQAAPAKILQRVRTFPTGRLSGLLVAPSTGSTMRPRWNTNIGTMNMMIIETVAGLINILLQHFCFSFCSFVERCLDKRELIEKTVLTLFESLINTV